LKRKVGSMIVSPAAAATCRIKGLRKTIELSPCRIIEDVSRRFHTANILDITVRTNNANSASGEAKPRRRRASGSDAE
jgi:hypothetical protein